MIKTYLLYKYKTSIMNSHVVLHFLPQEVPTAENLRKTIL